MRSAPNLSSEGPSGSGCYVGSRKFCNRGYYESLFGDPTIRSQPDKDLQMCNELCNSKKRQTGREEYNTKYQFVFTRKGPDRITRTVVTNTMPPPRTMCTSSTLWSSSRRKYSRKRLICDVIGLSSIMGWLYVCVFWRLVLLRSVEIYWAIFYLLYHSMSWRQPKGSDSGLTQNRAVFLAEIYRGAYLSQNTVVTFGPYDFNGSAVR